MSQQTIDVGKSRDYSFLCVDQNNNVNPVDPATGELLMPVSGSCVWSLRELGFKAGLRVLMANTSALTGFTLTPSEDTYTCNVQADEPNVTLVLICTGDRGDGVMVDGADTIDSATEGQVQPIIAMFILQAGPQK
jgi:hypothetical protein